MQHLIDFTLDYDIHQPQEMYSNLIAHDDIKRPGTSNAFTAKQASRLKNRAAFNNSTLANVNEDEPLNRRKRCSPVTEKKAYQTVKPKTALSDIEYSIKSKCGYEWKNIWRNLTQMDSKDTGIIDLYDFDRLCLRFKINFTKEELKKIAKNYRVADSNEDAPYGNIIDSNLNQANT